MSAPENKRNIEIKARIHSAAEYERRVEIAKKLTNTDGEIIPQHDIFYKVPNGRLKLRFQKVNIFQLSLNSLYLYHILHYVL